MDIRPVEIYRLVWWVQILGCNRRVFVRRREGERMISARVVPTMKHGGGGVMVWGCFAIDTVCDLFRIQGTLNQHGYHRIVQRYAILSGLKLVPLSFVFRQDNDPTHLSWPPQSPDLNPIEMVWDELEPRI